MQLPPLSNLRRLWMTIFFYNFQPDSVQHRLCCHPIHQCIPTPFFALDMLAPLVVRLGNSFSAISKHHFTYLNAFRFNSCALQLKAVLHLTRQRCMCSFCILHSDRINIQSLKLLREHMNRITIFYILNTN